MSERLDSEDFERQVGHAVTFSAEAISFEAEIKQVDLLTQHSADGRQPFAVLFSTDHSQAFAQKTYTMQHPEMGDQMIFLVPVGPDETGMCYEAIFN